MNDLVTMVANINRVNVNNSKNTTDTKQNINSDSKSNNLKSDKKDVLNNNFKSVLSKASKFKEDKSQNVNSEIEQNKVNEISEDNTGLSDDSKSVKKKNSALDILLILLLQHFSGEKVDLKKILEKLKEEGVSDDVTQNLLKLMGDQDTNGVDLNSLKSQQSLNEKVNTFIKALSQNDNDKNNGLKDILDKLNLLNNKDVDESSIKTMLKGLKENKSQSIEQQIISELKSKILDNQSDSTNINEDIKSPLKLDLNSKITVSNDDDTKNGNNEEDFLKNLVSKDKSKADTKIDRLTTFMSDFNKVNNTVVKDIENEVPININKNNLVNDFIKSIKYMQQNDVKEMTVKVMPRELGEIVIRLTVENGLMKANITANNKEAYNLLNSKAQELNNSLGNGEIKIQNFTIDIYNGDTTFFSRENSKEHRNNSNSNTKGRSESIQALEDVKDNKEVLAKELDSNVSAFV
ncbi:flagellar hook-length control protein [Clostridium botulinum]|uniref:Flagellar hook-length control protein n=1 Tax=Clostridium botulinum TaxID=1491 RepID=A0A9Q1V0J1_CLOBO|nr:flagellar hook-length control protein FliK [Clostridium botulinum]AEB75814.1 putative flagellar hook-length control protein [Clostridium botulinum BKT015925]KEI05732.1 flagellar hook-length control protein [Clostridium botulinum C/D str. Sp77]KOA76708.1 flagellar hook-length control protein [Clostridium botulinum]KOA85368.1 flagellar hook-length control protein [Clostridium botulinum]KOA86721.1 flagellar hook-length control protein [Clostridium botulinum]